MNTRLIFFLMNLKNAAYYKKEYLEVEYVKDYIPILTLLYKEGYIQGFKVLTINNKQVISIYLRFLYNTFALSNLKLLSKKSCVKTITYKQLSMNIYDIHKNFFISTNKGLTTQIGCKIKKLGGTLIFIC